VSTDGLVWYRVRLDRAGKVTSCEQVDSTGDAGMFVFYVRAKSLEAAGKLAFNAYCAANNRRRRARYAAEGKCRCGRERDGDTLRCSECLAKQPVYEERRKAKLRGEPVAPLNVAETYAKRRESEAAALRLAVLMEVREAWRDQPNNGAFTRWLTGQIEAIAGKRVA
jgi:hypothetical protein